MIGWSMSRGRSPRIWLILSRTSWAATSTLFSSANWTKTCETPSVETERSSSMPEIVFTARSIRSVISVSMSSGAAPAWRVVIEMVGNSTFGNRSTPRLKYENTPTTTRDRTSTEAKTGRRMEISASHCTSVPSLFPDGAAVDQRVRRRGDYTLVGLEAAQDLELAVQLAPELDEALLGAIVPDDEDPRYARVGLHGRGRHEWRRRSDGQLDARRGEEPGLERAAGVGHERLDHQGARVSFEGRAHIGDGALEGPARIRLDPEGDLLYALHRRDRGLRYRQLDPQRIDAHDRRDPRAPLEVLPDVDVLLDDQTGVRRPDRGVGERLSRHGHAGPLRLERLVALARLVDLGVELLSLGQIVVAFEIVFRMRNESLLDQSLVTPVLVLHPLGGDVCLPHLRCLQGIEGVTRHDAEPGHGLRLDGLGLAKLVERVVLIELRQHGAGLHDLAALDVDTHGARRRLRRHVRLGVGVQRSGDVEGARQRPRDHRRGPHGDGQRHGALRVLRFRGRAPARRRGEKRQRRPEKPASCVEPQVSPHRGSSSRDGHSGIASRQMRSSSLVSSAISIFRGTRVSADSSSGRRSRPAARVARAGSVKNSRRNISSVISLPSARSTDL